MVLAKFMVYNLNINNTRITSIFLKQPFAFKFVKTVSNNLNIKYKLSQTIFYEPFNLICLRHQRLEGRPNFVLGPGVRCLIKV